VSTPGYRVDAVIGLGFTARQASFLVTVMLHSGICVQRQYCAFANLAHGEVTRGLFRDLVERRYATAYPCAHNLGRLYHVHGKALYAAIGEPHNRNRRAMSLGRAVERLMALDVVIGERTIAWLGTEQDKVAHFSRVTRLHRDELPRLVFKSRGRSTTRFFPDKLPIGVHPGGDKHEFIYVVTRRVPVDLRPFLYRHSTLLRMLPAWRLRLFVPAHLAEAAERFHRACEEELGTRLAPSTVDELRWYFGQRGARANTALVVDQDRYRRARRAFGGPRYHVLYRHWLTSGDSLLTSLDSPVLPDALEQGTGRIESHVVTRRYQHLAPFVGTA
jgi:hypothetical protein